MTDDPRFKLLVRECWTFNSFLFEEQREQCDAWIQKNPEFEIKLISSDLTDSGWDHVVEIFLSTEKALLVEKHEPIVASGISRLSHAYCVELESIPDESDPIWKDNEPEDLYYLIREAIEFSFPKVYGAHLDDFRFVVPHAPETLAQVEDAEQSIQRLFDEL